MSITVYQYTTLVIAKSYILLGKITHLRQQEAQVAWDISMSYTYLTWMFMKRMF